MTKREAAVVMAYTGVCTLQGEDFGIFHEYCEKLLGHPIYTHQFPDFAEKLKELSKQDFIEICKNLTD